MKTARLPLVFIAAILCWAVQIAAFAETNKLNVLFIIADDLRAELGCYSSKLAMLFDEANDPHEMKNLAEDPKFAGVRKELSALVRTYVPH